MKWLDEIKSHRASSDVLLSLIGPHWVSIMKAREQAAVAERTPLLPHHPDDHEPE